MFSPLLAATGKARACGVVRQPFTGHDMDVGTHEAPVHSHGGGPKGRLRPSGLDASLRRLPQPVIAHQPAVSRSFTYIQILVPSQLPASNGEVRAMLS
nr:hypothetical protein CFP56_33676 [Quercus suber]POE56710.1 hypothetical protein CFP56_33682 [Quercus suber]